MVPLEQLINQNYIDQRLSAVMTHPQIYDDCVPINVTFELFMHGFQDGFKQIPKRHAQVNGVKIPSEEYRNMVFVSMGEVYTLGYQLGNAEFNKQILNPYKKTLEATHIYRLLGYIGNYIGDPAPYQQLFEQLIEGKPHLRIIKGEG